MRVDLKDKMIPEIMYCMEVARWLARVYENEEFAAAANGLMAEFTEAVSYYRDHGEEPLLGHLAYQRHQRAGDRRWVQLDESHVKLLKKASTTVTGALDATPDSTSISLGLGELINLWDSAPSVCPKEATCSSYPSCPCEGGIPV